MASVAVDGKPFGGAVVGDLEMAGRLRRGLAEVRGLAGDVVATCGRRLWLAGALALAAAAAEGAGLLMLVPILHMLGLVGGATPGPLAALGEVLGLGGALALFVGAVALSAGVVFAFAVVSNDLVVAYGDALRFRMHAAVLGMGWGAEPMRRPTTLVHALVGEVGQVSYAVEQLLRFSALLAQLPILLAAAVALSPLATGGALVLLGGLSLLVLPLNRRAHALATAQMHFHRAVHAEVADQLAGFRMLKVLRAESRGAASLVSKAQALGDARRRQAMALAAARLIQSVLAAAFLAIALWGGTRLAGLALSELLGLVILFARLAMVGNRLQESWRQVLRVGPIHAALQAQLQACRAAAEPRPADPAPVLRQGISLEAVGYRHAGERAPALSGVTARIPAFATTALVGPSGAGKSTLADLVMGLVAPTAGAVLVDGVPLDGPARVAWRSRLAYVPQDPFLFHDSIRANLLLARPDADDAALWRALEDAAAGFVRTLPQGLDTVVGDRGTRLSGGERQRVALARALLTAPDLLVLDEATSALDTDTEERVLDALRRLHGRLTLLLVAHRPSTIAMADHVIRLRDGRVEDARIPTGAAAAL